MNRRIARAAAISLAGITMLAPAAASADPGVSGTVGGQPFVDGTTGMLGQTIHLVGTGCINSTPGQPAYMGEFVTVDGDPWTDPAMGPFEVQVDAGGGFTQDVTIPLDNGVGTFGARWYCSDSPVSALTDSAVQWVGPLVTMSISDSLPTAQGIQGATKVAVAPSSTNSATQMKTNASTQAAAIEASRTLLAGQGTGTTVSSDSGVSYTMDPDSLPAIDHVNIPGDVAAQLKAEVDAKAAKKGRRADRRGRGSHFDPADNADYVAVAFKVLTHGRTSDKEMAPYIARLDNGEIRVAVIEDIALTAHNAGWWIKHT